MSEVKATAKGVIEVSRVYVPKGIDDRGYVVARGSSEELSARVQSCRGNDMLTLDLTYDTARVGSRTLRVKGSLVQAVD